MRHLLYITPVLAAAGNVGGVTYMGAGDYGPHGCGGHGGR